MLLAGLTAAAALHLLRSSACRGLPARREWQPCWPSSPPELAHTKIGSVHSRGLSGGQRKRVSIGIELLADPAVLLVDEPTSGLDAKMAQDVMSMLKSLSLAGRTALLPTAPLTRPETPPLTAPQPHPGPNANLNPGPNDLQAAPSSPRSTSRHTASSAFRRSGCCSPPACRLAYSGGAAAAAAGYFAARGFRRRCMRTPAEHLISLTLTEGHLTDLWAADGDAVASASASLRLRLPLRPPLRLRLRLRLCLRLPSASASASAPPPAATGVVAASGLRFVSSTANQVTVLLAASSHDQVKDTRKLTLTLTLTLP